MKRSRLAIPFTSAFLVAALGFAAAPAGAGVYVEPTVVIGVPGVVIAPQPVVEYSPAPFDVYITNAQPADVIYLHGDTFIWAVDGDGRRYQRFYAHGDRRAEVFSRRDELQRVSARNGGRLPNREGEHRQGDNGRDQHRDQERRRDENRDEQRN
jgi:hypothetical protein